MQESKETLEEDCQVKFSTNYGVRNPTEFPFNAVLTTIILYIGCGVLLSVEANFIM